jgi:hypothetical protein
MTPAMSDMYPWARPLTGWQQVLADLAPQCRVLLPVGYATAGDLLPNAGRVER